MDHCVDLDTPRPAGRVGRREVGDGELGGDHQVRLHVADQVLDDPFRRWVLALTEVGPEPVVGREPHVVHRRDHNAGDGAALQAAHPIRQRRAGNPAQFLEARCQARQGGVRAEVVGEEHEPPPAPREHRAEHEQRADLTPVERQHVTGRPHAGPAAPVMIDPPPGLRLGDQPTEVSRRTVVASGRRHREQALRGDPPLGLRDPLDHDGAHVVVVVHDPFRRTGPLRSLDDPLHGLVRGAADVRGAPIGAHLSVGGIDVHTFPH